MKVKLLLAIALFWGILQGCKKTDSFSGDKVSTLTDFKHGYILTYTYNSDGSIATIVKNIGGKTTYDYASDKVVQSDISNTNVLTDDISYMLNGSGYADSAIGSLQLQNYSAKYIYNSDGQVVQQRIYNNGTLTTLNNYTIVNKNVTDMQSINLLNNTLTHNYYTYVASYTSSIEVQNVGKVFFGVGNSNVKIQDLQLNQNGDTLSVLNYKYKYDGASRIDTLVSYDRNGHLVDSAAYTYY